MRRAYRGPKSDHFDGERFFNPGAGAGRSFAEFWRWRRTRRPRPWPRRRAIGVTARVPGKLGAREIAVTYINHATFLIQLPGLNLLTDPVYAERAGPVRWVGPRRVHAPGLPFEQLPHIDVVFVSHNHYDHLDLRTLRRLARRDAPQVLTGLGTGAFLRASGVDGAVELDWWQLARLQEVDWIFTPARHWSSRGPGDRNRTLWGGLWLRAAHGQVYFAGDSGYGAHFSQLQRRFGAPELSLLPIGAYEPRWFMREQHMNPAEAVRAHLDLHSRRSVATHYGCFQLSDEGIDEPLQALEAALEAALVPETAFPVLRPGETLRWRVDEAHELMAWPAG